MKELIDIAKQIQEQRKNPVLILDLKYVQKLDLLHLHKLLGGKTYDSLDVILQTDGGDINTAFVYAKLLRKTAKEKLNIIIPPYTKCAGTLLCLVADNILMTELSEVSPLDTHIREIKNSDVLQYSSALNGFKTLEQIQKFTIDTMDTVRELIEERSGLNEVEAITLASEFSGETSEALYNQLNPARLGEYGLALEVGAKYGKLLLTRYMGWDGDSAENTINKLVYHYPSHDFAIDAEELQSLGLPAQLVDGKIAPLLFQLWEVLFRTKKTYIELIEYAPSAETGTGQEGNNNSQKNEHEVAQNVNEFSIPQN